MLSCRHFGHWRELAGLPQPAHLRGDVSSVVLGCDSPTEGIVLSVAGMECPSLRIFKFVTKLWSSKSREFRIIPESQSKADLEDGNAWIAISPISAASTIWIHENLPKF